MSKHQLTEFLQRCVTTFKNRYDYVEVRERFQHMYSRVPVQCPSHGRFWVVAKAHMKGEGCIKCERKEERQIAQRREATLVARDRSMERVLPGYKGLKRVEESTINTCLDEDNSKSAQIEHSVISSTPP